MVQVACSGQLVAFAEVEQGEIVPRRVFNLAGIAGRAGRETKVGDDVDNSRA
jgi:tRNA pseudouridine55 synthase